MSQLEVEALRASFLIVSVITEVNVKTMPPSTQVSPKQTKLSKAVWCSAYNVNKKYLSAVLLRH